MKYPIVHYGVDPPSYGVHAMGSDYGLDTNEHPIVCMGSTMGHYGLHYGLVQMPPPPLHGLGQCAESNGHCVRAVCSHVAGGASRQNGARRPKTHVDVR